MLAAITAPDDRFIMPANTTLAQDKATLLKLWAAMGEAKQTLTNGSDDVSQWKGITVSGGRVTQIGERMLRIGKGKFWGRVEDA